MEPIMKNRLVIKIGSNVLMNPDKTLDTDTMRSLCKQVSDVTKNGYQIVLVSSGAVAAGRESLSHLTFTDEIARRQVLASVGQVGLMNEYSTIFKKHQKQIAQILVTKEDFRDRNHYLNMRSCLENLLMNGIIPIINENDAVAITELMFTDNDELATLVSGMLNVSKLIILSNVDGIFTGPPTEKDSTLIHTIETDNPQYRQGISAERSSFGRGGMLTKATMASKLARLGIEVVIANGKKSGILPALLENRKDGTRFVPKRKASNVKKWLAYNNDQEKGKITVDAGAVRLLVSPDSIRSLLPVGVTAIEGNFQRGDLVGIYTPEHKKIALGLAQYGYKTAKQYQGKRNKKPLVHYDYLYVLY